MLPLAATVDIAADGDEDCFSFQLDAAGIFQARTDPAVGACDDDGIDTILGLFPLAATVDGAFLVANDDEVAGTRCSAISANLPAGAYKLCVVGFNGGAFDDVVVSASSTPIIGDEAGGRFDPLPVVGGTVDTVLDLSPAGDEDCFSVTLNGGTVIELSTGREDAGACVDEFDPSIAVYAVGTEGQLDLVEFTNDTDEDLCESVTGEIDTVGTFIVCFQHPSTTPLALTDVRVTIDVIDVGPDESSANEPSSAQLPFELLLDVYPATDEDCVGFDVPVAGTLVAQTSGDGTGDGGCSDPFLDTYIELSGSGGPGDYLDGNDDIDFPANPCSLLTYEFEEPTRAYLCLGYSPNADPASILGVTLTATFEPAPVQAGVVISEVYSAGGLRYVELFNATAGALSLTDRSLLLWADGNGQDPDATLDLAALTIQPFDVIVIANDALAFGAAFPGLAADVIDPALGGDGNDVYTLLDTDADQTLDVYGVLGTDGAGEVWEYTEGVAQRSTQVRVGSEEFFDAQWTITASSTVGASPGTHLQQ